MFPPYALAYESVDYKDTLPHDAAAAVWAVPAAAEYTAVVPAAAAVHMPPARGTVHMTPVPMVEIPPVPIPASALQSVSVPTSVSFLVFPALTLVHSPSVNTAMPASCKSYRHKMPPHSSENAASGYALPHLSDIPPSSTPVRHPVTP